MASYIIRNLPKPLWDAFKAKSSAEGIPMKAVMLALVQAWVSGSVTVESTLRVRSDKS